MKNSAVVIQNNTVSDLEKKKQIWKKLFLKRAYFNMSKGSKQVVNRNMESEPVANDIPLTINTSDSTLTYLDFYDIE